MSELRDFFPPSNLTLNSSNSVIIQNDTFIWGWQGKNRFFAWGAQPRGQKNLFFPCHPHRSVISFNYPNFLEFCEVSLTLLYWPKQSSAVVWIISSSYCEFCDFSEEILNLWRNVRWFGHYLYHISGKIRTFTVWLSVICTINTVQYSNTVHYSNTLQ